MLTPDILKQAIRKGKEVFIADTGSSDEEKMDIKTNILPLGDINLIEYDYYNFAKINNDVVKNHLSDKHEFLLFCNNDIKILNNVIYGMLKILKEKPKAGTIGCRLHFEDNTVQHDGVIIQPNPTTGKLSLTHASLGAYYSYTTGIKEVMGNTAALMMIRKKIFSKIGGYNEEYTTCFEDVELNLSARLNGFINYYDGSLVSYHYESQTRGKNEKNSKGEYNDYVNMLIPFIEKHHNRLFK
jgi:GT2 family glycosyltransferase